MVADKSKIELRNVPLAKLKRTGKVLEAPTKKLNMQFSAWVDHAIPENLWSILLISFLPRQDALASFRRILGKAQKYKDVLDGRRLEHSRLAELNPEAFDLFFADECTNELVARALSPLLVLDGLPDRKHWHLLLPNPSEDAWTDLALAIGASFNHQSQSATDCRWLKVMTAILTGQVQFSSEMNERVRDYFEYPNRGDPRSVRSSIRALEMTFRPGTAPHEVEHPWMKEFWEEGWARTHCIFANPDRDAAQMNRDELFVDTRRIYEALIGHFLDTVTTTSVDARHDACFGLTFYIMQLAFFALKGSVGQSLPGRTILRSSIECYITLAYLVHHDNDTIWLQYRRYGAGQSKLAFLKRQLDDDPPSFISVELLEELASQDLWIEHLDIHLGAWANKNLRSQAEEAGEKEFYDRYYDSLSGYVHGNWSSVCHSTFGLCFNPLHRFHRIPAPPRLLKDDSLPDLIKVANRALEKLNQIYPTFKPRFKKPK